MVGPLNNSPDFRVTDYKDMVFPLYQFSKGEDMFHHFPIFSMYKCFFAKINMPIEKVMIYISYCFDKGSPFVKKYNDVVERRFWSALEAGFKLSEKTKAFSRDVEDMIRGKNREVNNMIIQYVILQGDENYSVFVAYNEALKQQLTLLLNLDANGVSDNPKEGIIAIPNVKDIKTITENISNLRSLISEIRMAMFFTVEDRLLNESLYDFMEAGNLGISPESYAEKKLLTKSVIREEEEDTETENEYGGTDFYEDMTQ